MRFLAFVLSLSVLASLPQAWAETPDGVVHVRNGATPRDGVHHAQLREQWRAGGEDDDIFFGLVAKVATDAQGHAYVLDSQTCQVYMYSPEGELLRVLFREGEGPGEIRQARDMVIMADGRIGVIQELPGAISFVNTDGTPAGRAHFVGPEGGTTNLTGAMAAGNALLLSGTYNREGASPSQVAREMTLERFASDGSYQCRYAETTGHYDFTDFHFIEDEHLPPFWFTFDSDSQGRVYTVTNHENYAIRVFSADGKLEKIIQREYKPLARTKGDIRRLELMILSAFNAAPFKPRVTISPQESALSYFHRAVHARPDGSLWALSGRGVRPAQDGVMAVFDVFDKNGKFVRQEALHAPHDAQQVGIFFTDDNRVLVIKGYMDSLAAQFGNGAALADEDHEPQAPEVICYTLE